MTSETGCGCSGACAPSLTLDPHKRVHYSQGQVLGVDEFIQEEYYFLEGARRHHRTLHGYGTLCGLGISASDQDGGVEVRVDPGHAIDTHGRELHVGAAQCARLDTWIADQATTSPPPTVPSPPILPVWVVLCYRECRTDLEPIPGGPCRTADESMTPTRVTETFSIRFDLDRPDMTRLDAIRDFAALVDRLDPTLGGTATITPEEFADAVAALAGNDPDASPPVPASPPVLTSPPGAPIEVPDEEMRLYLTVAFHAWVTRVRPALMPEGTGCAEAPGGDGCIALAQLQVPILAVDGTLAIDGDASAVVVDDTNRPLLLSTQVLQELLIPASGEGGAEAPDHAALSGLDADDHLQYLLIEPRTGAGDDAMVNSLSGEGAFTLRNVPTATGPSEVMPWGQGADGDLDGNYPDPQVVGLQGLSVPVPAIADAGRHLTVRNDGGSLSWDLTDPPVSGGGGGGEAELVRLRALSWVHNSASDFQITLNGQLVPGLAVGFGAEEIGDSGVVLGIRRELERIDLGSLDINSFRVFADIEEDGVPAGFGRRRVRLLPETIVAIQPDVAPGDAFFNSATVIDTDIAPGACLVFSPEVLNFVMEFEPLLWIEIDGDHVRAFGPGDDRARAVDTEFLRSRLPAGDRPEGADLGTQGGLFSSWINRASQRGFAGGGSIDLNAIDMAGLVAFGLTRAAATRVIGARTTNGPFRTLNDVLNIPSLSGAARNTLSDERRVLVLAR
ncbi:hypothetical protein [Sedimentitalea sp.]|uniref:hypothetical protein n=1 Tax=Sedimentitalea sp. TaxID=2048915 RepID=UPI0032971063